MFTSLSFKKFQRRIRLPFTFFKKLSKKQRKGTHKRQASRQIDTPHKSGIEEKSVQDVSGQLSVPQLNIDWTLRLLLRPHSMSKSHPRRTPSQRPLTLVSSSHPPQNLCLPNLDPLRARMRLSAHSPRLWMMVNLTPPRRPA
jgi:hypothetical protein